MNTAIASHPTTGSHTQAAYKTSPVRRVLGIVARPRSYENVGYLLLGLPLGTLWFAVLISALSVSVSMLVVALFGIPMFLGTGYLTRAFANVERRVANVLLDQDIPRAPIATGHRGNLWVRLKAMTSERDRWRELGYLMLRFPVGVATFTAAVTALTAPVIVAYAPIHARNVDDSFGDWFWSSELERFASTSPWSWFLVPLGLALLIGAFHALKALANGCGRWTAAWLGIDRDAIALNQAGAGEHPGASATPAVPSS